MSDEVLDERGHHIWCNWTTGPASKCKCQKLWDKYYYENGKEMSELAKKHFPNAVKIK